MKTDDDVSRGDYKRDEGCRSFSLSDEEVWEQQPLTSAASLRRILS